MNIYSCQYNNFPAIQGGSNRPFAFEPVITGYRLVGSKRPEWRRMVSLVGKNPVENFPISLIAAMAVADAAGLVGGWFVCEICLFLLIRTQLARVERNFTLLCTH